VKAVRGAVSIVFLVAASGCFRTVYRNLEPTMSPPGEVTYRGQNSGWQHFFIWGWVPSEKIIDAAGRCGGADRVLAIKTRQTFVQGLVEAFAGYYVNVYSPYTGQVVCVDSPAR